MNTIYHGNTGRGQPNLGGGGGGGGAPSVGLKKINRSNGVGGWDVTAWEVDDIGDIRATLSHGRTCLISISGGAIRFADAQGKTIFLDCDELRFFDNLTYSHVLTATPTKMTLNSRLSGMPAIEPDDFIQKQQLPAGGQVALMVGSNHLNCGTSTMIGLAKRVIYTKLTALSTGIIKKMACFVYNSYGTQKIELGIYDRLGLLQRTTDQQVIPPTLSKTYSFSIPDFAIVSGVEYWVAIWGDGIDIPADSCFSNLGGSFPDAFYCLENVQNPTSLPISFNQNFPTANANRPTPIICLGA